MLKILKAKYRIKVVNSKCFMPELKECLCPWWTHWCTVRAKEGFVHTPLIFTTLEDAQEYIHNLTGELEWT